MLLLQQPDKEAGCGKWCIYSLRVRTLMFAKGVKVRPPRVIKWPKVICPSNSAANNKSANFSAISAILIALCAH